MGKIIKNGVTLASFNYGTGSQPTLITKSITANNTYNAVDDNADGYSSVTVNVPSIEPSPALPSEYQRVEYLDIQGAYFTVTIPNTAQYKAVFDTSESSTANKQGVFGYRVSSTNGEDFNLGIAPDLSVADWYVRTSKGIVGLVNPTVSSANTKVTCWGFVNTSRTTAYIGAYYATNSSTNKSAKYEFYGKLYQLTGYTASSNVSYILTPVCDFVPCYRKSDNQVGLYDVVAETFYTPTLLTVTGITTSVTAGPDVN